MPLKRLQLSDLLKEKRQDVERDHTRRMEKMREAHQEALAKIRDQYEDEVSWQPPVYRSNASLHGTKQAIDLHCSAGSSATGFVRLVLLRLTVASWQEKKQRAALLETLKSERERLGLLHKAELETLQHVQSERLKSLHKSHQEQVRQRMCISDQGALGGIIIIMHNGPKRILFPCRQQTFALCLRPLFSGCPRP